ncbi:MAG: M28 family peptidase [Planctomycetota bacterium]
MSGNIDRAVIQNRLRQHVDMLAGVIGPRHDGKPETIQATRAYIRRQWEEMGCQVGTESFDSIGVETANLLVQWPGERRPKRHVLVGAHYDSIPETPGADDNASAVACMLEMTRLLLGGTYAKTLRFVAFANEEPPHFATDSMGSQVHARRCVSLEQRIDAMLCLEMVGYFSDAVGSQSYPDGLPKWITRLLPKSGDFLAVVANLRSARMLWPIWRGWRSATRLRLIPITLPQSIHEIRLSDHGPFWDQGLPAAMATDTSFFRNAHYHQRTDTPDTLDYERLTEVTLGLAAGAARLAGGRHSFGR